MGVYINGIEMPKEPDEMIELAIFGDGKTLKTGESWRSPENGKCYYGPSEDMNTYSAFAVPPHGRLVEWIPFKTRPMNDEEREYYSEMTGFEMYDDAVIYCSQLPEDGQEVLVCDKYGNVWQDIFCNDPNYGVGFETHGDMDGLVAWMPMPEPYKQEEGE